MKDYIAYCGLDCEACEARRATLNDDNALRRRVAKEWSALNGVEITPEMINCTGCRVEGVKTPYCDSLCPIRQCALARGVSTCGSCADMAACEKLAMILDNNAEARDNLKKAYRIQSERLTADTYIDFLKRTDLGEQYPLERFEERIPKLLKNASISLTARDGEGRLLGVLLGLTDFAYWLYVTDLGVDRDCLRQGIGRALMKAALELAGGEKDIAVYLIANENAIPFYERLGMKKADDVMKYNHIEWTEFTVR